MTGRRRRTAPARRWPAVRAAVTWRRVLVLVVLATLTTAAWTTSAHAAPTPTPAPSTAQSSGSGSASGTAGGPGTAEAAAGTGTGQLSDADKATLEEMQRWAKDTGQQMTASAQQQMADQATEALRKELPDEGGVLGVFNTTDQYGIPLSVYTINPDTGGWSDWQLKVYGFLIEICFMGTKWMIAFCCWLITWALPFGLAKILLKPVLAVAASLHTQVIVEMGLPTLCLTVAGTICAWHILLGDRSKGVGELAVTLLVSALAAGALVSPPTTLMGGSDGGMLGAAQGFSLEVASVIIDSGHAPGTTTPVTGSNSQALTRPITDALVDALVVKPAELLEYGRTFDGDCAKAYAEAKISQLAYDRKTDSIIHLIQDSDSLRDVKLPGLDLVGKIQDPTGIQDWAVDKVVSIAGGWVKDHYGHPPMQAFENKCISGDVGAAKKASVDKLAGAAFVLLAALIVALFICRLAGSFLVAQCRIALESIRGEGVLIAGTVPGGGRTVLWQWCATLLRVFQQLVMSVLLLAVFLVVITTLLDPSLDDAFGGSLALRFVVLDIVCIGAFVYRKKVAASARRSAANFRSRFEGSRIGGAGKAIFRAGPDKEPNVRRGGAVRAAVIVGALAVSGGTSTTMLGGGRSLARRITPGRRSTGPAPRPTRRQQAPGRNRRPQSPPRPGNGPTQPGNGSRGAAVPPPPTTPPPGPPAGGRPAVAPRARRVPPPRHTTAAPANSARQQALRRRLDRRTTPSTRTTPAAPRRRPQPRSGGTP